MGRRLRRSLTAAGALVGTGIGAPARGVPRNGLMSASEISIEVPGASVGVGAHHGGPIERPSELYIRCELGGGEELCELLNGESTGVLDATPQAD